MVGDALMMKQSVSQTAQSNNNSNNNNSADNFECIKKKGCGRELGRGRKGNCSGTRIKINKSGNDIKKTCGSIFFKLTPNPNASHSRHTICPSASSSTHDPFHFILATHAKCVACFWAMPHDIPLPCSFRWLSRCPRHAKLF